MKIKTSELIGTALDYMVAKCEERGGQAYLRDGKWYDPLTEEYLCYSTDWAQGGPIIEREKIDLAAMPEGEWDATSYGGEGPVDIYGPTPLIAAMRVYVASKLGRRVEVPEELL